jgi:signal transduction histidine kinase
MAALRVLLLGIVPGEEWLQSRLAQIIPPAIQEKSPIVLDDRSYDVVITTLADAVASYPTALVCAPIAESSSLVHLVALRPEQQPFTQLLEQQLYDAVSSVEIRQFNILRSVSHALASSTDIIKKLQQVLSAMMQISNSSGASAFLFDSKRQQIDVVTSTSDDWDLVGRRVTLDNSSIAQRVSMSRSMHLIPIPLDDGLKTGDQKLIPNDCSGLVVMPLIGSMGCIGGMLLFYVNQPGMNVSTAIEELLETIAYQTAIVVEDALLSAASRRVAEQMRLVNEVSREIAAIHDLDTILGIIPDRLTETFGYYHASVGVINQNRIEMYEATPRSRAVGPQRFFISLNGDGIIPWVARTKSAHLTNDTRYDSFFVAGKGLEASRSELAVPLLYRERSIGVIDVQSEHINAFDEDDMSVLEALAGQLAIAIENARLYEENRHQRQIAETLSRLSRLTGAILDVRQVSQTVLTELGSLLKFDVAVIALFDSNMLKVAHHAGGTESLLPGIRWLVEESPLLYQVLRLHDALVVPDLETNRIWQKPECPRSIRSWVAAPLFNRGNPVGVLAIASFVAHVYSDPDGHLLLAVANQIAVAVDNARLFEQLGGREQEARMLYEITRLLVSLDQEAIPLSVMSKLREALPFDVAGMLIGGNPNRLIINASRVVKEDVIHDLEERLLETYNTLSDQHINRRSAQIRLVFTGPLSEQYLDHLPSRLSAPLLIGRNIIGVMELCSAQITYGDPELRTLFIIANLTATALENARLYQELSSRALNLQRALDELAANDKLKDELVQNISHELRTPLTYIAGYVGLLLNGHMGGLQPEQEAGLKIIATKTQALTRLVSDMLSVDRATMAALQLSPVDIVSLAQQAIVGVSAVSTEAGIQLIAEMSPNVGAVMANADRLSQVFDNLLGNAIKFSSSGGIVKARVMEQGNHVRVEIEDTGIGIPADKLPHVFERFFQIDTGPRRRYGGVGLGLTICKQIIEAHGGTIGVSSEEGVGSLFYFELPKAPAIS